MLQRTHFASALLVFLCSLLCASASGLPYLGHDISSLFILEESNVTYINLHGQPQRLEEILKSGGMNAARMRIWVNPEGGDYDLAYNLQLAKRMQSEGIQTYLDFHYSDTWADPSHQAKPAAWANLSFPALVNKIGQYTEETLDAFHQNGIRLDIVSIGNEIRNGLLWPDGEVPNWRNIALLLKSASQAVIKSAPWAKIMVHIDNGWNWPLQENWYDSVLAQNILKPSDFDIQGVSYYPFYNSSALLSSLKSSTANMANKYGKPIVVAETDWPVQCTNTTEYPFPSDTKDIPFTVSGQTEWVHDILDIVKAIPHGLGQGLFYWEPGWLNNTGLGSECEDVLLFTGNWTGYPNSVLGEARQSVNIYQGI